MKKQIALGLLAAAAAGGAFAQSSVTVYGRLNVTVESSKYGDADRVNKLASTVPLGRGGQPEEIAETILWLLGEQSSYVSGAIIDAAGAR